MKKGDFERMTDISVDEQLEMIWKNLSDILLRLYELEKVILKDG